jgi:cytochrome c-type biogenesis protein CcmH
MTTSLDTLKRQLLQLKELHASGTLSDAAFEQAREKLERQIVDSVLSGTASSAPAITAAAIPAAPSHSSAKLLATIAAVVLLLGGLGYWWKGSFNQLSAVPASASAPAAGAAAHDTSTDQIAAMADKLAAKLKDKPQDPEGWAMLARSYTVLGKNPEALVAYERALALRADDANLHADYADALAMKNNRSLEGAPMKEVEIALKLDPKNIKALALAGTAAFERKDYLGAVKYWEQVVKFGSPEENMVKQIKEGLAQARQLSGQPAPAPSPILNLTGSGASITGTVTLSKALAAQASPEDALFVFARPVSGERMPLAILRKQVKDLPLTFTLDDSLSMSPTAKLSSAKQVVVSARISKSGNAMPQTGDLSGQSGTVNVGANGIRIDIAETVK